MKSNSSSIFEWKNIQGDKNSIKPPSRWGHSACVVEDNLYIFGGFASN